MQDVSGDLTSKADLVVLPMRTPSLLHLDRVLRDGCKVPFAVREIWICKTAESTVWLVLVSLQDRWTIARSTRSNRSSTSPLLPIERVGTPSAKARSWTVSIAQAELASVLDSVSTLLVVWFVSVAQNLNYPVREGYISNMLFDGLGDLDRATSTLRKVSLLVDLTT